MKPHLGMTVVWPTVALLVAAQQQVIGSQPGTAGQSGTSLCSSGVVTGKTYQLINQDGTPWSPTTDGHSWSPGSGDPGSNKGTFKFCKDEPCTVGHSIDPPDSFTIKDVQWIPPSGIKADAWVYTYEGPGKLSRTYEYKQAGVFSITKWSTGQYCISGAAKAGTNPIYPSRQAAGSDLQSCVEVGLKEVPDPSGPQHPGNAVHTSTEFYTTIASRVVTYTDGGHGKTETAYVTKTETVTNCPVVSAPVPPPAHAPVTPSVPAYSSVTSSGISPTTSSAGSYTCNGTAYFVTTVEGKVTLYNMDLSTGHAAIFATDIAAGKYTTINSIGFNARDNYLYGIGVKSVGNYAIVRISTNGALTEVLPFTSPMPVDSVGDFDTNGQFWVSDHGKYWIQFDLLPNSPTYGKLVNYGTSTLTEHELADWAYLPGHGEYMYALARSNAKPHHLALIKWSLTAHKWEYHQVFEKTLQPDVFLATWGGSSGTIWGYAGDTGQITRVRLVGGTPEITGKGPSGINGGDGARCALAA